MSRAGGLRPWPSSWVPSQAGPSALVSPPTRMGPPFSPLSELTSSSTHTGPEAQPLPTYKPDQLQLKLRLGDGTPKVLGAHCSPVPTPRSLSLSPLVCHGWPLSQPSSSSSLYPCPLLRVGVQGGPQRSVPSSDLAPLIFLLLLSDPWPHSLQPYLLPSAPPSEPCPLSSSEGP